MLYSCVRHYTVGAVVERSPFLSELTYCAKARKMDQLIFLLEAVPLEDLLMREELEEATRVLMGAFQRDPAVLIRRILGEL